MYDPGNGQLRYLIHFDDGGSGMRMHDEPLDPGAEFVDCGGRYRVVRVEPAPNSQAFGHVWAELIEPLPGELKGVAMRAPGEAHGRRSRRLAM